jgi:hypothetical protein
LLVESKWQDVPALRICGRLKLPYSNTFIRSISRSSTKHSDICHIFGTALFVLATKFGYHGMVPISPKPIAHFWTLKGAFKKPWQYDRNILQVHDLSPSKSLTQPPTISYTSREELCQFLRTTVCFTQLYHSRQARVWYLLR